MRSFLKQDFESIFMNKLFSGKPIIRRNLSFVDSLNCVTLRTQISLLTYSGQFLQSHRKDGIHVIVKCTGMSVGENGDVQIK